MGRFKHTEQGLVFEQETGQVTARFSRAEEKMALVHEGSPFYRRVFFLLTGAGLAYLGAVFALVY